jgi:hypothetical protein
VGGWYDTQTFGVFPVGFSAAFWWLIAYIKGDWNLEVPITPWL